MRFLSRNSFISRPSVKLFIRTDSVISACFIFCLKVTGICLFLRSLSLFIMILNRNIMVLLTSHTGTAPTFMSTIKYDGVQITNIAYDEGGFNLCYEAMHSRPYSSPRRNVKN